MGGGDGGGKGGEKGGMGAGSRNFISNTVCRACVYCFRFDAQIGTHMLHFRNGEKIERGKKRAKERERGWGG